MNTFLRHSVNNEPLDSHPPAMFKPAPLSFPPKARSRPDLPNGPADAHGHHAEEQDPHPGRDIAEDFASGITHGLQTFPKSLSAWSELNILIISGSLQRKNGRRCLASLNDNMEEPFKQSPSLGGARQ